MDNDELGATLTDLYASTHIPSPRLLAWVAPLVFSATTRLEAKSRKIPVSNRASVNSLLDHIRNTLPLPALVRLTYRPLLIDLHNNREQGTLSGHTSEDRFTSYIDLLQNSKYRETLWGKYPVINNRCAEILENWLTNSFNFIKNYIADIDNVVGQFALLPDQQISSITANIGDPYRLGQQVIIIKYISGDGIVYKPRDAKTDTLLADVLAWFNAKGFRPILRSAKILDFNTHSWCLFEKNTALTSANASKYYRRYGGILAALSLICATDMYRENIVDNGDHPTVIDSETIAHSATRLTPEGLAKISSVSRLVASETVLGTGALPTPRVIADKNDIYLQDTSPLNTAEIL